MIGSLFFIYQFPPYYWGNEGYKCKIEDIKNNELEVSTIAFGSSVMWNNFHPETFDNNLGGVSYNLSSSGMSLPESIYLLENIIENNEFPKLDLVLLEICPEIIGYSRDNTHRMSYFYSKDIFAMQIGSEPSVLKNQNKFKIRLKQIKKFVHNIFSFGMIKRKLTETESDDCEAHTHSRGYKVVELWDAKKKKVRKRNKIKPKVEKKRAEEVILSFENYEVEKNKHNSIVNRIMELEETLRSKDINLVGVFMPRLSVKDYEGTRDLFGEIGINKIDYSDPTENPALWDSKLAVDMRHYNLKGAKYFTDRLAEDIESQGW